MGSPLPYLDRATLRNLRGRRGGVGDEGGAAGASGDAAHPIRLVQFGEGNFLRCFVGWMVDVANEAGSLDAGIAVVQPLERGTVDTLRKQGGLYTVVLKGVRDGQLHTSYRVVTAVQDALNPYQEWDRFLTLARSEALEWFVSNTTEAGISYEACSPPAGECPSSYPAKLTAFLHERFRHFDGDPNRGLHILPCELNESNGDRLREIVLRHAADWELSSAFVAWLETANCFFNTLVDRVVSGYPKDFVDELEGELGYRDRLMVMGELYHSWIIEDPEQRSAALALEAAGLNLKRVSDLRPYRQRKVRILNGAHTGIVPAAVAAGLETVQEMIEDEVFGPLTRQLLFREVLPYVPVSQDEAQEYAEAVLARFANPAIRHYLRDIVLNSVAKFSVRVFPTIVDYAAAKGELPPIATFSLAALIWLYGAAARGDSRLQEVVRDREDIVQRFSEAWEACSRQGDYRRLVAAVVPAVAGDERDAPAGLVEATALQVERIERGGLKASAGQLLTRP